QRKLLGNWKKPPRSDKPFAYGTLNGTKREIRLIRLEPGQREDAIHCTLIPALLEPFLKFEALSYAWETWNGSVSINVDNGQLQVTKNLEAALLELRRTKEGRIPWIDALCINQADNLERNHQAGMMKEIYESASSVLIWLGPENSADAKLVQEMPKMAHKMSRRFKRNGESGVYHLLQWNQSALEAFLGRSWWSRIWVKQEYGVSKHALFLCGRIQI
ncbi:hypothetical protein K402DRAFT_315314, partial [Aulographum hederae CBS 113979]